MIMSYVLGSKKIQRRIQMETSKILRYLGAAIIIILLLLDTFSHVISSPVLIAGLWIGAIIEIIGFYIERRNKK